MMKLNVTTLSSYLYCPRKLYFQYVLGIFEPMKDAVALGSIKHSAIEHLNNEEQKFIESLTSEDKNAVANVLISKYCEAAISFIESKDLSKFSVSSTDVFNDVKPFIIAEASYRAKHVDSAIKKHNVFGRELWNVLDPKIKTEFSFESNSLMLKGRIDKIEFWNSDSGKNDSRVVPFELKSGSMPKEGVWPGHKIQAASYAMLIEDFYKVPVSSAYIHYVDHNEIRPVVMNAFLKDEVKTTANKVFELFRSSKAPELCKGNKCEVCGIKSRCWNFNG